MAKFKIPENPPTVNKTVRFPFDVVEQVEQAIQGKDCTFSGFVIAAVRAALDECTMEEPGCFACMEKIVCALEAIGSDGVGRRDVG